MKFYAEYSIIANFTNKTSLKKRKTIDQSHNVKRSGREIYAEQCK